MKKPDYPMGPVLTIGMVREEDRVEIVKALSSSQNVELTVDGKVYPVSTVAVYQFAMPSYRRKRVIK